MKTLISYDFSDPYQRNLLIHLLESEGCIRIQKSLFIGEVPLKKLYQKISKLKLKFKEENDSVLLYSICSWDFEKILWLGLKPELDNLKKEDYMFF